MTSKHLKVIGIGCDYINRALSKTCDSLIRCEAKNTSEHSPSIHYVVLHRPVGT